MDSLATTLRIANAVGAEEYATMLRLGGTVRQAQLAKTRAIFGVLRIAFKPEPTIYQTEAAKMICGRARND